MGPSYQLSDGPPYHDIHYRAVQYTVVEKTANPSTLPPYHHHHCKRSQNCMQHEAIWSTITNFTHPPPSNCTPSNRKIYQRTKLLRACPLPSQRRKFPPPCLSTSLLASPIDRSQQSPAPSPTHPQDPKGCINTDWQGVCLPLLLRFVPSAVCSTAGSKQCWHWRWLLPLPLRLPHRVRQQLLEQGGSPQRAGEGEVSLWGLVDVVDELVSSEPAQLTLHLSDGGSHSRIFKPPAET